ncbi:tyrosine-type recombinase/integrase [Kosakonia sacchari]
MALTDIKVRTAKPTDKQYKLTDGSGMHLLVHPNGSKYWRLQYRFDGKQKMLVLGVYPEITLADARARRDEPRKLLANGVDPGGKKKNDKVEQSKARTFKEVAIEWHGTNKKWSEDHAHRVLKSLEDNLFVALGERNITELKTRDLLASIKAVEISGRLEVAARLQQRATAIMRYAVGDHDPRKPKPVSENMVNKALWMTGYDTKTEVCCHSFRTMACSSLIESGLGARDAVEKQMSHQERNSVRAAYIHKAGHLDERRWMSQCWAAYLDANRDIKNE